MDKVSNRTCELLSKGQLPTNLRSHTLRQKAQISFKIQSYDIMLNNYWFKSLHNEK